MMAIGALHAAARLGLHVPDDLSIIGFDGIDATKWTVPELTTVEQPIAQIADTAVQTLQTLIEQPGRPLPSSYFRPTLRVRASTGKPRYARSKTSAPSRTTPDPPTASSSTTTVPRA